MKRLNVYQAIVEPEQIRAGSKLWFTRRPWSGSLKLAQKREKSTIDHRGDYERGPPHQNPFHLTVRRVGIDLHGWLKGETSWLEHDWRTQQYH